MLGAAEIMKFGNDVEAAYVAHSAYARAHHEQTWEFRRFYTWWCGLMGKPRPTSIPTHGKDGDAIMATATAQNSNAGRLTSPMLIDDPKAAYKAYKNGPWAKSPTWTAQTYTQFKKRWTNEHPKAVAKQAGLQARSDVARTQVSTPDIDLTQFDEATGRTIAEQLGIEYPEPEVVEDEPADDLATVLHALVQAGASPDVIASTVAAMTGAQSSSTPARQAPAKQYRQRKSREATDEMEAARNAVLWALNTENLIGEALDTAIENGLDYITQEIAQDVMTKHFGPLPERNTTTTA